MDLPEVSYGGQKRKLEELKNKNSIHKQTKINSFHVSVNIGGSSEMSSTESITYSNKSNCEKKKKGNKMERGSLLNNRFKILQILGSGSYGTVYLANDTNLNREVAIKELHPRFAMEAQNLASIPVHKNIIKIYHSLEQEQDQNYYYIMEYIPKTFECVDYSYLEVSSHKILCSILF